MVKIKMPLVMVLGVILAAIFIIRQFYQVLLIDLVVAVLFTLWLIIFIIAIANESKIYFPQKS